MYATPDVHHRARPALLAVAEAIARGEELSIRNLSRSYGTILSATLIDPSGQQIRLTGETNPLLPPNEYFRPDHPDSTHTNFAPVVYLAAGDSSERYEIALRGKHAQRLYHSLRDTIIRQEGEMIDELRDQLRDKRLVQEERDKWRTQDGDVNGLIAVLEIARASACSHPAVSLALTKNGHSLQLVGEEAERIVAPFLDLSALSLAHEPSGECPDTPIF